MPVASGFSGILAPMIAHLTGTVHRVKPGEVTLDVHGVGYRVLVPLPLWDELAENAEARLSIASYIREDRFDLFGFSCAADRALFEECIKMSGIGPSLALELCSVPRNLLLTAIQEEDPALLTNIKGIGRKRAEKLLVDLKSSLENHPAIFTAAGGSTSAAFDQDALAALTALGYDHTTSIGALKALPKELVSTEDRVKAALQSL